MAIYTIHAVTHSKWDNSLSPLLTVKDGDVVEVRETSNGQVTPSSTAQDLVKLDFSRIHPLTEPIVVILHRYSIF
ncbi:formamidase/acetamidase [Vulcanisaeta distributa DSM 14429]|uniref:Formamidase/acetamidase n=1 Tax=Vulcanisaeta distributa (strain DSM 14429 / JCM 11212 / NBRC 100878 / IC-017) TaxID=572478 RepID=E1QU64_VULDI|nr:acetamidase/formamidase family protein [Vulcanisaeta distributa]ADN51058.1 formamidase/acetamidase [Vulcanisaeta distributa DSM 14429]